MPDTELVNPADKRNPSDLDGVYAREGEDAMRLPWRRVRPEVRGAVANLVDAGSQCPSEIFGIPADGGVVARLNRVVGVVELSEGMGRVVARDDRVLRGHCHAREIEGAHRRDPGRRAAVGAPTVSGVDRPMEDESERVPELIRN